MISPEQAEVFTHEWIEAWNSRDLERILSHYTDDFEMTSPKIITIAGEASGTLKGKPAIRAYWRAALDRNPHLRFTLVQTLVSVDSIVIYYTNQDGKSVAEVVRLGPTGQGTIASAHYSW